MSRRDPSLAETKRKEFAIFCRNVRLWIAGNPGIHNFNLAKKFGKKVDYALGKMVSMGIIEARREVNEQGGYTTRWYVIAQ